MPYIAFKDTINKYNANKHDGYIPQVNLCVAGETKILTDAGQFPIADLVGQNVNIWNGFEWSNVLVKQTGTDQALLKVHFSNGEFLECTYTHKFHIDTGKRIKIKEARDLRIGESLIDYYLPLVGSDETQKQAIQSIHVTKIQITRRIDNTYCFNEPKRHLGVFNNILTGQCTESFSNVASGQYAHCCNLVSLNLANIESAEELADLSQLSVRILDNTIDLTSPPFEDAKAHNNRYRTVGVGTMGLADYLAKHGQSYKDTEAIGSLFEIISYNCILGSAMLAGERGRYLAYEGSDWSKELVLSKPLEWFEENGSQDWESLFDLIRDNGIRNSMLMAIAPNTSSSLVQGCTASILPCYSKFYYDKWSKGTVPIAPPFIKENLWYYKENKKLDQNVVVKAVSEIQKWIDTGISMELVFNLNEGVYSDKALTAKDMYEVMLNAWESECKAIYYVRVVQKDNFKEECVSCAN
jgi:ribonucleoside-diphosphate reductase alpha chain